MIPHSCSIWVSLAQNSSRYHRMTMPPVEKLCSMYWPWIAAGKQGTRPAGSSASCSTMVTLVNADPVLSEKIPGMALPMPSAPQAWSSAPTETGRPGGRLEIGGRSRGLTEPTISPWAAISGSWSTVMPR